MARDSGLIFAEQPRRRRWPLFVLAAGLVLLIAALPRLAVLLPAGVQRVDAALAALVRGGALTVCAYSGGLQGTAERDAVLSWARALCPQAYRVAVRLFEHEAGCPPVAVCIEKKCASRPPHSS